MNRRMDRRINEKTKRERLQPDNTHIGKHGNRQADRETSKHTDIEKQTGSRDRVGRQRQRQS